MKRGGIRRERGREWRDRVIRREREKIEREREREWREEG